MHRTLLSGVETPTSATPEGPSPRSNRDPYRGVVFVLLIASVVGAAGALAGELTLANPLLLDTAITFGLATGILACVALAQAAREGPAKNDEADLAPLPPEETVRPLESDASRGSGKSRISARLTAVPQLLWKRFMDLEPIQVVKFGTAAAGVLAIVVALPQDVSAATPSLQVAGITALICLVAAGLAATAAHYLADVEPIRFPEALGLSRGARVVAWILVTAAASMILAWAGQQTILRVLHFRGADGQCGGVLRPAQGSTDLKERFSSRLFPSILACCPFSAAGQISWGACWIRGSGNSELTCARPGRLPSCAAVWSRCWWACACWAGFPRR